MAIQSQNSCTGLIPIAAERGAFVIVVNTEACGASCNIELLGKAGDILP